MKKVFTANRLWFALFLLTVALCIFPVTYRIIRIFFLISLPGLWLSAVFVLRKKRAFALSLLSVGFALMIFICLPGFAPYQKELKQAYVEALEKYEGTRYVWGGENRIGIDCSGLVRNGLINANLQQGITTLNPRLIRKAFAMWWYDCSALALRDGYMKFTRPMFKASSVNAITNLSLFAGDIAVTSNGAHVLAYLGNNRWIEADPLVMKTIIVSTPSENIWFNTPVHVLRWSQCDKNPRATICIRSQLSALATQIEIYQLDIGHYPVGLSDLLPSDSSCSWDRPGESGAYLKDSKVLHDSWGNKIYYTTENNAYKLKSLGSDGIEGTTDDIEYGR